MALVARLFPLLEESRSVWTRRAPTAFSILLRLDSGYTSPRFGPLCRFEPKEVIQRIYELADIQGMGKPSAHNLTVISIVLHHMICSILLPRGEHRDKVFYYEAFLMDSILTGRWIHLGYLMMMHMISCCESTTRVLPYGHFLTTVFKDAGVDLSRKTDFEAPKNYDMYDDLSMGRMKFEKAPDGSQVRRAQRPPPQPRGQGKTHPRVEEEAEIREMRVVQTLIEAFSRENPSLTFLHFSQRVFSLRPHFLS